MGRRRVVLFIVTSFWAHGELTIATEFAGRMRGSGFQPLFLIPPSHRALIGGTGLPYQVLIPGAGKVNRLQLQDIQHVHRPVAVVLADFLNYDFCDRHYGLTRDDLTVFECPIGTFDNFSWGRPGSFLDTYGFRAAYQNEVAVDGLSFRLRPCPLNNPLVTDVDAFAYPLIDPAGPAIGGPDAARQVRADLGVRPGNPLILLTGATWQRMHVAYPIVENFVRASTTMLEWLLRGLLDHADVVSVGSPLVFHDGAPPGFHTTGSLSPMEFRRLAAAVDLHISNNLISVSLHRLALAGIPSVALFSSLVGGDRPRSLLTGEVALSGTATDAIRDVGHLYAFRMFPVGWFHFLHSLVDGNPFTDVIRHVEIFDDVAGLAVIRSLLDAGPERDRLAAARERYLAALADLPDVPTILDGISAEVHA
ncbi:DUF6365 family protein [Virgisporangium aurantiacum]|uniref:DUF6365 family protein n=1 Tax=Virgisporangium aurantiacum TaxID=175570 RepID=UPI001951A151|nr:DUF6365 family protein [Virgisporangium aurantiacum]